MEELSLSSSGFERGGEFWKELPDDVLEELYRQLEQGPQMSDANDILTDLPDEFPNNVIWNLKASNDVFNQMPTVNNNTNHLPLIAQPAAQLLRSSQQPIYPIPSTPSTPAPQTPYQQIHIKPDPSPQQFQFPPSPQYQADNARAKQLTEQLLQLHNTQEQQLETLKQNQRVAINQQKKEEFRRFQDEQTKLSQQMEAELKELHQINRTVLLDPQNLHQSRVLALRIHIQQQRLELLKKELHHYAASNVSKIFGSIVITDQPIPQVVFKGKVIEDPYVIHFFTGANAEIQSASKMRATLLPEDPHSKDNPLENDVANMDAFTRVALFHNLKIGISTRMAPVHLRFALTVHDHFGGTNTVESSLSYPLIVITNESQWTDAAGKLILADAFAGQMEVSWSQFSNAIHHHFLKSTRQDPSRPSRALTEADWKYIYQKFFVYGGAQTVSQQAATQFWLWFGQVVCTLRFKRHINSMFFTGLIYGFITKEQCNQALQNQELGTFMIRFSETYPGLFAVAYVSDDPYERVKHYLVKPEDISSNKTLPDFLREKPQFQCIYQLDTNSGILRRFPRDTAFGAYYSKARKIPSGSNGYVLL